MALTQAQLGDWEKAQESLVRALNYRSDSKLSVIDNALQATLVSSAHAPHRQLVLLENPNNL